MNLSDRELLARTLQAEAGNQGLGGMLAAGSVVMNRANTSGYGNGLRGVILKPGQFSAWNSLTGYAGGEQGQNMTSMRPSAAAYQATDQLLTGDYEDPTGGATHYYNPDISNPSWAKGKEFTRIGDHVFGFADAGRGGNRVPQTATTNTQGAAPMMQQEEKPRGLLDSVGIQKMEEGAEGETGQRFFQRDSFKDTAALLAQGFGRMGIMGMEEIADDIAKQRTENKAKNKTMEALMKMGTPQAQAAVEYINAGGDPVSALKMAFAKPEKVTPYTDAAKLKADFDRGLISQDTFEAEMAKPAKATSKEAQIARLESTGVPRNIAIRIADGSLVVSTHPVTGAATLVDKAELSAQQAAQVTQPAEAEAGKDEDLGANIFANKNARQALGAVGFGAKIGNVLFDTFGLTPKMGNISEAQNALEFLSTETTLGLAASFPGRPSNLVREEIRNLTVKPADILAGPDKALGKSVVLVRKLDEYIADMQEIVGGEFSPEDTSKARLSIQTLQPIREGYASLNARLREQLEPNSKGGGTALRPEVSEALGRY